MSRRSHEITRKATTAFLAAVGFLALNAHHVARAPGNASASHNKISTAPDFYTAAGSFLLSVQYGDAPVDVLRAVAHCEGGENVSDPGLISTRQGDYLVGFRPNDAPGDFTATFFPEETCTLAPNPADPAAFGTITEMVVVTEHGGRAHVGLEVNDDIHSPGRVDVTQSPTFHQVYDPSGDALQIAVTHLDQK